MMKTLTHIKQLLGSLVYDWPKYIKAVSSWNKHSWCYMRNRNDALTINKGGVKCNWDYTRKLHLCNLFPSTSSGLLNKACRELPIELTDEPKFINDFVCNNTVETSDCPEVSFMIGHRGLKRLDHLLLTLKSIATQLDINFECIVVEQDNEQLIKEKLPSWIRYIHTPLPNKDMPYSRSWTFNVAAEAARGEILIGHDNDMFIPELYAYRIAQRLNKGFEVINPKRFIFYTTETCAKTIFQQQRLPSKIASEFVIENLEAGGSFGITKEAYLRIGGFDEEFIGWGGEDNEFWDRCNTLKIWEYADMPIIHLWHESQPMKYDSDNPTAKLLETKMKIPPEQRIKNLTNAGTR